MSTPIVNCTTCRDEHQHHEHRPVIVPSPVARGILAAHIRAGHAPEVIEADRQRLATAKIAAAIDKALAAAPPLTEEQTDALAARLRAVEPEAAR